MRELVVAEDEVVYGDELDHIGKRMKEEPIAVGV
jgi:hypothetical protein